MRADLVWPLMKRDRGDVVSKVAVVTGASAEGSIAYGIALAFARAGWDVALVGRHMKRTSQAAHEIAAAGESRVEAFAFEATRESGEKDAASLAAAVDERLGSACVLVNAAQAAKVGDRVVASKLADLSTALDSGVMAAYLLMRAFYPQLAQSRGMVANLLSAGAASGQAGMGLLAASKEGLRGLSRVAATEWEGSGVRVECLEPRVRTSAFSKWAKEYPSAATQLDGLESVDEFAARVVALAQC